MHPSIGLAAVCDFYVLYEPPVYNEIAPDCPAVVCEAHEQLSAELLNFCLVSTVLLMAKKTCKHKAFAVINLKSFL